MEEYLILKCDQLLEARYKLNLNEQNIIIYAINKIDINKKYYNIINIDIKEFYKLTNLSIKSSTELNKIIKKLRNKEVILNTPIDKIITGWFSSIKYNKKEDTVDLEFSHQLIPCLVQLNKKSKKIKLENIFKFKNSYSIKLYEAIKEYEDLDKKKFELKELKDILFIDGQYKRIYDLERFVLKPAMEEINKYTDIRIRYEKIKSGIKVTDILFEIRSKDTNKS